MKILLAADGSEAADRAATFVATNFGSAKPEVYVIAVLSYSLYPYGDDPELDAQKEVAAQTALEHTTASAVKTLEAVGAKIEVVRKFGFPADVLDEEIKYWAPDLVVLGRRGLHGPARWLGSVSEHVLHHATVPVLLVP